MKKIIWLGIFTCVLIWSAINPKDYLTWLMEVAPALIGLFVIAYTYKFFPLTPLVYILILTQSIILMIGGYYTYAEVPLFDWISDWSSDSRNNYDKVGHFAQGFVPFFICREIIIRNKIINGQGWQIFFSICFCLAFSALYELIEWWTALAIGQSADAFLGTQGYAWDTQSDMWYALLGAVLAWLTLVPLHNKQLKKLHKHKVNP